MENKACILKNTVVTLNMYLNLVRYNLMPHRVYIKDIESSRNVLVITSSVKKKTFYSGTWTEVYIHIYFIGIY